MAPCGARAESVLFDADRTANGRDGDVFPFESWLERLGRSLAKSSFILIDHRLKGAAAPTVDLRSFTPPGISLGPMRRVPDAPESSPNEAPPGMPPNAPEGDTDDR